MLLTHTKINRGLRRRPFALRVFYDADELPVRLEYVPADDVPELYERLPVSTRVVDVLRRGPRKVHEIADEVGADSETVSRTLRRLRARGIVMSSEDLPGGGRGKVIEWMLARPS
jgi:DNA-binding transcriptional ArsR family regulator